MVSLIFQWYSGRCAALVGQDISTGINLLDTENHLNNEYTRRHIVLNRPQMNFKMWAAFKENSSFINYNGMGLLPDAQNCGLRMRRKCRERFIRHWLQRKPLVSDPGMHHGTCVTPWCMLGSPTRGGGENVPGIPGSCATRTFVHLVRCPLSSKLGNKRKGL